MNAHRLSPAPGPVAVISEVKHKGRTSLHRWPLILILVGATIVTYAPIIGNDFVSWDDPDTISGNPRLSPPTIESVGYYWRHAAGGLYIPVTYTYWGMLAIPGREDAAANPRIFHAGSVLLHVVNTLLVLAILRQVIPGTGAASFIGAALFALHPVQVETVAWASGAKDLLAASFSLVSIDQFLRFARSRQDQRGGGGSYAAASVAFVLAILAKPSAVVVPMVAAVLAWARFRTRPPRSLLVYILPMLVLSLACIAWSRVAQLQYAPTDTPLWLRPLIAADAIAFYFGKLVWPAGLRIIYGRTPQAVLASGLLYYTWIIPLGVAAVVWWARRKTAWPLVGLIIFLVALSPVLGFARFMFQIHSTVADHYLYLPMLGAALAVAGLVSLKPVPAVAGGCAAVLAVLAIVSVLQIRHWRDSEAVYARVLEFHPNSGFARGGLGRAYAESGRIRQAIEQFHIAVELVPTSRTARIYLAQAYLVDGQHERAIAEAMIALRLAGAGEDTSWERFVLEQAIAARRAAPADAPIPGPPPPTKPEP
jgi:protein O-mannosyl-transferase